MANDDLLLLAESLMGQVASECREWEKTDGLTDNNRRGQLFPLSACTFYIEKLISL
jgi:hypothetical protein